MSIMTMPPPLSERVIVMFMLLASFLSAWVYLRGIEMSGFVLREVKRIPCIKPLLKSVSVGL